MHSCQSSKASCAAHQCFIHSFISCFPIRRSGPLQQTFYGSPPTCPVLVFSPPCTTTNAWRRWAVSPYPSLRVCSLWCSPPNRVSLCPDIPRQCTAAYPAVHPLQHTHRYAIWWRDRFRLKSLSLSRMGVPWLANPHASLTRIASLLFCDECRVLS